MGHHRASGRRQLHRPTPPQAGELTVVDTAERRPVAVGVALISTIAQLWPGRLTEVLYPTRANPSGARHADLLLGVAGPADRIRHGDIVTDVPGWPAHAQRALLH